MNKPLLLPTHEFYPASSPGHCMYCREAGAQWRNQSDMFGCLICAACVFRSSSWGVENKDHIAEYLMALEVNEEKTFTTLQLNQALASLWITNAIQTIQNLGTRFKEEK